MKLIEIDEQGQLPKDIPIDEFLRQVVDEVVPHYGRITDQWSPKTIAEMHGFQFKLAKLEGDFVWHSHPDTDEAFFIIEGQLRIDFHDGQVTLNKGEMFIVPQGIDHKPFAESECHVMVLVREGTINTGDAAKSELTADPAARI